MFAELSRGQPSLATLRRRYDQMLGRLPVRAGTRVERVDAAGVSCLLVTAPGIDEGQLIVLVHGGGFVMGSAEGYRGFAADLSAAAGSAVLVVDYRLAPEHPYPAPVDDVWAAVRFAMNGWGAERVAVIGDSAGGGLVLGTMLRLRDEGEQLPCAGVLLSPVTDLTGTSRSLRERVEDPVVRREGLLTHGRDFLGERDPRDTPYGSPMHGDPHCLPPLLVLVGDGEALLDDALGVVDKVRAAGGQAELLLGPGMVHIWPVFASILPEGRQALDTVAHFLRREWGASLAGSA